MPADTPETVTLRPVREDDLPLLERFLTDPEACGPFQWYGWRDPHRFRRSWAENGLLAEDGGQLMVTTGTERHGFVAWRKITVTAASYHWNIGIQLLPDSCGRGIGTRAQLLLARYLFAHTPVVRIEADTEADNIAEQRALEKAGFRREGVLRGIVFRDGGWRDGVLYSLLRGESPAG
ncbi:GNAT family N-acetyltransferase [Streptomyces griseosporeus]|uniref:GNAT family N-acetyltransferase n=1 Tax=Streptomyces griseosporeus TaxID=1910 RepID=UPI0036FFE7BD